LAGTGSNGFIEFSLQLATTCKDFTCGIHANSIGFYTHSILAYTSPANDDTNSHTAAWRGRISPNDSRFAGRL